MRIAQVNLQRDWGGAERHVSLLSRGLRQAGAEVVVCCHPRGGLLKDAQRQGLECRTVSAANQMDLPAALSLAGRLARFRPDIVHVHTPRDYLCGFLASRLLPGAVLALTRHMMLPVKPMMRRIYRRAGAVFCLSAGMAAFLEAQGIPRNLLRRVQSGIETSDFGAPAARAARESIRADWNVGPDDVAIGCVGRLVTGKGHSLLLEAAERIFAGPAGESDPSEARKPGPERVTQIALGHDPRGPRIRVVFIGEGPERDRLEQQARVLGLSGLVHFAGLRSDIPQALTALDIFALTSEGELLPLSVMEAMASGLPVVATEVGGLAEIVESEVTGLLVPPKDAPALASALRRLVESAPLRQRLGESAAARARQDFTLAAMASNTIQAYREVLHK